MYDAPKLFLFFFDVALEAAHHFAISGLYPHG